MYEFHNKYIGRKYDNCAKFNFVLVIIQKIQKFLNPVNKKVIDKKKDEVKGKIISQFVGLKLKYAFSYCK